MKHIGWFEFWDATPLMVFPHHCVHFQAFNLLRSAVNIFYTLTSEVTSEFKANSALSAVTNVRLLPWWTASCSCSSSFSWYLAGVDTMRLEERLRWPPGLTSASGLLCVEWWCSWGECWAFFTVVFTEVLCLVLLVLSGVVLKAGLEGNTFDGLRRSVDAVGGAAVTPRVWRTLSNVRT